MKKIKIIFALLVIIYNLAINTIGCANASDILTKYPNYAYEFVGNDPYENFNRKIFNFNLKANKYVIRPINVAWASVMPQYGMYRVENFYTNLNYPARLVSCLVQKDFKSSKTETVRFFTNTTLGIAGLYDPALTKFNIKPRKEDMGQALAYKNVKKGPYLVLPIVANGNIRDIAGQALDLPLNPCSYIVGPISLASTGLSLVNDTTSKQSMFRMAEDYADPYAVSKESFGIDKYIKTYNIDRNDYIEQRPSNGIINIKASTGKSAELKADVQLNNFNPQGPTVESMRTILFDNQCLNDSIWSELSVWNKSFVKKVKTASIEIDYNQPKYQYRYILQKDKSAPLAIIYPSIGEGVMSSESIVQAKVLYDNGYSVAILGSAFSWQFTKSMPNNYKPGLPYQDAKYLRSLTSKTILDLELKQDAPFKKKVIVGNSFGAITALFVAKQEGAQNTLGVSNYIVICPPVELFYALKQIDKYAQNYDKNAEALKNKIAIAAEKVIQLSDEVADKDKKNKIEVLPISTEEAEMLIGFVMQHKLSDVVFTIEHGSRSQKSDIYDLINNMSFYDYAQKYLIPEQNKTVDQLNYDSSLYALSDYLKSNNNYKIYHSLDDCFVSQEQLIWLKNQTKNKSVFLSNGSHLGFLYRKEFLNELQKDLKAIKNSSTSQL